MTIDEFLIAIGLKTDGVKKGAKEVEDTMSKTVATVTAKLSALGAAFAAAFSVAAEFKPYLAQADALGKLSAAIDQNIEDMDAWGQAAARSGGSAEAFQGTIQSLSSQLARIAATGNSRIKPIFEDMGVDAGELGRGRQVFDVLKDLAAQAETMSKSEFFGKARLLGLDTGTIMLLQQGRQGVKDLVHEMKKYGVYTKVDADLTATFNDNMANSQKAFHSLSTIIFRSILPAINKFHTMFNNAMALLVQHETFVKAFISGVAIAITGMLLPALKLLTARLAALALNPVVLKLTAIIALITLLALAIEDMFGWMEGKDAEFADFWAELWGTSDPQEAKEKFESFTNAVSAFFTGISAGFSDFTQMFAKVILCIRNLDESWDTISKNFMGRVDQIKSKISDLVDIIANGFTSALDSVKAAWDNTIGQLSFPSFGGGKTDAHANGGIFNSPHMGLVAEAGAEAIIPLSASKRGRALDILGSIAGNFVSASQALPMGGASTVNNTTDTRVTVGTVNISAADGTDAAAQFMGGIEQRAQMWTAAANVAY